MKWTINLGEGASKDPIDPSLQAQYAHWGVSRIPSPEPTTQDHVASLTDLSLPQAAMNLSPTTIFNFNMSSPPRPLTPADLLSTSQRENSVTDSSARTIIEAKMTNLAATIEALARNCFNLQQESVACVVRGDTRGAARYATAAAGELNCRDAKRKEYDALEEQLRAHRPLRDHDQKARS